jgi:hypothetical protein
MYSRLAKTIVLAIALTTSCSLNAEDRIYLNGDDIDHRQDCFRIHVGHNVWLETETVHRDESGLYTFEHSLSKSAKGAIGGYKKSWKCPYCFHYWPIGTACQNKECPSKYK